MPSLGSLRFGAGTGADKALSRTLEPGPDPCKSLNDPAHEGLQVQAALGPAAAFLLSNQLSIKQAITVAIVMSKSPPSVRALQGSAPAQQS